MNEFEKWLEEKISDCQFEKDYYRKNKLDELVLDSANREEAYKKTLIQYQSLTKDKIVLVLDKEEANTLLSWEHDKFINHAAKKDADYQENDLKLRKKLKQALEVK